MQLIFT